MTNPNTAAEATSGRLVQANAQTRYHITRADLPLHCPLPGSSLWNSHPRVYLPIEDQGGHARCPYCGAEYLLED